MATASKASAQSLSHAGIGASEIAAIAGMNPFASPWDVWLKKTGQAPEFEGNALTEWGHRLEPAIRQKYADDLGVAVHVPPTSLFSSERAWARATPDGVIVTNLGNWSYLLQCKNVGEWVGKKGWDHQPPAYVQLQEQWEMYVTGLARADVAALIGGNDFRIYTVHRDDKVIADLLTIADAFWRKVETRTPPPVDDSDACQEHFESRFVKSGAVELQADEETERLFVEWQTITADHKRIDKRIKTIRNLIRKQLAEAKADRISSSVGMAKLSAASEPAGVSKTNWRLVAELVASAAKCDPEQFNQVVEANTTIEMGASKAPTLYAPTNWKEKS